MKAAEALLKKLETYEQCAYNDGIGGDWLERVGEGFKFYVRDCVENGKSVTLKGFIESIDQAAKHLFGEP